MGGQTRAMYSISLSTREQKKWNEQREKLLPQMYSLYLGGFLVPQNTIYFTD